MAITMSFDFTNTAQNRIRTEAADAKKSLRGYKHAVGGTALEGGVPIWFSVPYTEMFGESIIKYDPEYTVYIDSNFTIGSDTTLSNKLQSPPVKLGDALTFKNGVFTTAKNGKAGTITLNREDRSEKDFAVGLCAKVDGKFQIFCAFTLQPENSISMEPKEEVILCSGGLDQSGSVTANTASPGCKFPLDASHEKYDLALVARSFGVTAAAGGASVTDVPANENIKLAFS